METASDAADTAGTLWTRSLRAGRKVASVALVGAGAWHITNGFLTLSAPDGRHIMVGAALVVIGLLGLFRHASRLRKPSPGASAPTGTAPHDPKGPLRIAPSKRATTRLLLSAGLMCALSIIVMVLPWVHAPVHAHASHPLIFSVIGWVGLLFFGACLIWITRRRLDGSDALIADRMGLYDRSNALGEDERVPWRCISGFHVVTFLGQRFIAVDLADPDKFVDRAHGWRRFARSANRRLVGSPWCITPGVLGWSAATLAERLEAQRAQQYESR